MLTYQVQFRENKKGIIKNFAGLDITLHPEWT